MGLSHQTITKKSNMQSSVLSGAVLALLCHICVANKVAWQSKKVNETVTAEATIDILIKNFDADGDLHGTLRVALFGETVPMTVLNFQSICNGVKRPSGELKYASTYCHRMVPDENFDVGISEKGTVAMANKGPNSNGSQFFVTFRSWQYLDGYHVGFGQVVGKESLEFLQKINEVPVDDDGMTPKRKIKIVDCQSKEVKKYKIQRRAAAHEDSFE